MTTNAPAPPGPGRSVRGRLSARVPAPRRPEPGGPRPAGRRRPSRRTWWAAAEASAALLAALGFAALSTTVDLNPLVRIDQVSGLAELQLYVALLGLPLLALLVYTAYRGSVLRHQLVKRLVCAALAGLSTGVIAGGTVLALSGTSAPLGGQDGDPSTLVAMANSMLHGHHLPGVYPPGFPAAIAAWSEIRYGGVGGAGYALHDL
ncbi:hypothetical protein AB0D08_40725, partial [Kitasatospora sp. NPDC048540]